MAPSIYLDNAATTPVRDAVLAAMLPAFKGVYGNPSSAHQLGVEAARALNQARRRCAEALGVLEKEIVFCSGGTEANNLAIRGCARALRRRGQHIICSAIEHPSVLETCRDLCAEGFRLTEIAPDADGRISPEAVLEAVEDETILVSIMEVQNELGTINPIAAIARAVKERRPELRVHCDGIQAAGKRNVPDFVDLYTLSGHKLHGPKGIGALVVRGDVRLLPGITGGGQEIGRRSGTENLPGILGLAEALALAVKEREHRLPHWRHLRGILSAGLEACGGLVNGPTPAADRGAGAESSDQEDRVAPNILSVSFPGFPAEVLLHSLEGRGVFVSNGSACASKKRSGSHVLEALGLPEERRSSTLRFSFGAETQAADIDGALEALRAVLTELAPLRRSPRKGRRRRGQKRVT